MRWVNNNKIHFMMGSDIGEHYDGEGRAGGLFLNFLKLIHGI